MTKYRVFIDGSAGTTGLRIHERLQERPEIELLAIGEEDRKDLQKRAAMINQADLAFLCLPDAAAKEIVPLIDPGGAGAGYQYGPPGSPRLGVRVPGTARAAGADPRKRPGGGARLPCQRGLFRWWRRCGKPGWCPVITRLPAIA